MSLIPGAWAQESSAAAEWMRMREGLKQAKPMPDPPEGRESTGLTPAGDLMRFDPLTGQASRVAIAKLEGTARTTNRMEGKPGEDPIPAGGDSRAIEVDKLGVPGIRSGNKAVMPLVTPTQPQPLYLPYGLPHRTVFKLMMRFTVPNFADRFFFCSASAVSSFHLISAGHCVYNHDPLGDGSKRGAGFAAEIWAWPAQTDVVEPIHPIYGHDYPWGIAKMKYSTAYNGWINSSDFNWDIAFITLDRRIGNRVGTIGVEYGAPTDTLFYSGYPMEEPYVPANTPYQYPGVDLGNVISYSCCRISMQAYVYGGHSGGPVFRDNGTYYYLHGVNSTSNRAGGATAALFTSQTFADLLNTINRDRSVRPPVDKAELIEYAFDDSSKGLYTTSVAVGEPFAFKINAYNVGYTASGPIKADIYLTRDLDVWTGTKIGTVVFDSLGPNQYQIYNTGLIMPTTVQPGTYRLGWVLHATNSAYGTDNPASIISKDQLRVVGLTSVLTNPSSVAGGTTATGSVILTTPAPPNGVGHGIDVLLSSNKAVAQFTNFVHVNEGDILASFNITTSPVTTNTTVTITANLHGTTKTTTLLITPKGQASTLNAVSLVPASVVGGSNSTGTINLTGPAPAGGMKINLASSHAKAIVPKVITVAAGASSATFPVKALPVTATTAVSIKATYSGVTKAATLTIKPVQPATITLSPAAVKGGSTSVATITINGPAPAAGATVSLTSSNTRVKVPATVSVNAGSSSVTVNVTTMAVTTSTSASIKATAGGVSKAANLILQP